MASAVNDKEVDASLTKRSVWIQINNTVLPIIYRQHKSYIPLNVLQYAAGILDDPDEQHEFNQFSVEQTTKLERMRLNGICAQAGLRFPPFPRSTLLVSLDDVHSIALKGVSYVKNFTGSEPFKQARFIPGLNATTKVAESEQKHLLNGSDSNSHCFQNIFEERKEGVLQKAILAYQSKRLKEECKAAKESFQDVSHAFEIPNTSDIKLTLVRFFGKSVPCVVYNSEVFTSTDSLHRIYFNSRGSVDDLDKVLQKVIRVPLVRLNEIVNLIMRPEGHTTSKKSLLYVKLKDVADKMDELQYGFGECTNRGTKETRLGIVGQSAAAAAAAAPAAGDNVPLDLSQKKLINVNKTKVPPPKRNCCRPQIPDKRPKLFRDKEAVAKKRRLEEAISNITQQINYPFPEKS